MCINTDGNYTCECRPGYTENITTGSCEGTVCLKWPRQLLLDKHIITTIISATRHQRVLECIYE